MDYVADVLSSGEKKIRILSVARPIQSNFSFFRSEDVVVSDNVSAHFFNTFVCDKKIIKVLSSLWIFFSLFLYLVFHLKRNSILVVYHSMAYVELIILVKKLFHIKLILEVEEVYSDVSFVSLSKSKKEQRLFLIADSYIFPTELLDEKVNYSKKPSLIIYGNYSLPHTQRNKIDDGKIHVIYSGTFDTRKGGAITAIRAAEFLTSDYHVHITGMGSEKQVAEVEREIDSIREKSKCVISYDGFIKDEEFIPYLQQFHIGISSQNPDDKLSSSCFPSKILMYMSNGLSVLSSRAPAVIQSKISPFIYFYDNSSAKSIADQIMKVSLDNNSRSIVQKFDKLCKNEMISFLADI